MSSYHQTIAELRKERVHGSSWYFAKVSKLLNNLEYKELGAFRKDLLRVRPGMATMTNVESLLEFVKSESALRKLSRKLAKCIKESREGVSKHCKALSLESAVTISYSSAVLRLIESSGLKKLFIMKSLPGKESQFALKQYSKHTSVEVIPDTALCTCLKGVNAAVIGMDGIYNNGMIVNKIGSLALFACARFIGRSTFVIGETYKISDKPTPDLTVTKSDPSSKYSQVPVFEEVSSDLVDFLVTDKGVLAQPSKKSISSLGAHFRDETIRSIL